MGHSRARNPGMVPLRLLRTDSTTRPQFTGPQQISRHHSDDMFCVASAQADVEAEHKQLSTFKTDTLSALQASMKIT
jgi:hypothetical protein